MTARDYELETKNRVEWIRKILSDGGAKGIIFANSGGKDSALVGILCAKATENTLGVILPCDSASNYGDDKTHALLLAEQFNIKTETVDLTGAKKEILGSTAHINELSGAPGTNINPRLRMIVLYALGQANGYLVAGTGNKSEYYMGYFTKWGDGAYDFNPIADLTVREVYEFLRYLGAPDEIVNKVPSAGLYDGQTDEKEMGVTYDAIEEYMTGGTVNDRDISIIKNAHEKTSHKRELPKMYHDGNCNVK